MALMMDRDGLDDFLKREFPQVAGEFEVETVSDAEIRVRRRVREADLRPGGTVSGPTIFALVDVSVYLAVLARIGPRALAVTTNVSIDFMRKPAADRDLIGTARILKLGRVLAVAEAKVFSDRLEAPVARAGVTYAIPPEK